MQAIFHDWFAPLFQSAGTYTCLNLHFAPLAVSYKLFPLQNQRQLDFFSIEPNSTFQFSLEKFHLSYFRK